MRMHREKSFLLWVILAISVIGFFFFTDTVYAGETTNFTTGISMQQAGRDVGWPDTSYTDNDSIYVASVRGKTISGGNQATFRKAWVEISASASSGFVQIFDIYSGGSVSSISVHGYTNGVVSLFKGTPRQEYYARVCVLDSNNTVECSGPEEQYPYFARDAFGQTHYYRSLQQNGSMLLVGKIWNARFTESTPIKARFKYWEAGTHGCVYTGGGDALPYITVSGFPQDWIEFRQAIPASSMRMGATYCYLVDILAANGKTHQGSDDASFSIPIRDLSIATSFFSNVSSTSATLVGRVEDAGNYPPVSVSFTYGPTSGACTGSVLTSMITGVPSSLSSVGNFSATLSTLVPNTKYCFQAVGVDSNNVRKTGDILSFTTTPQVSQCNDGIDNDNDGKIDFPADGGCASSSDDDETGGDPIIPPGGLSIKSVGVSVSGVSASFAGEIVATGNFKPIIAWFEYTQDNSGGSCVSPNFSAGNSSGAYSSFVPSSFSGNSNGGIVEGATYCWRASGRDSAGNYAYGAIMSFTTSVAPSTNPVAVESTFSQVLFGPSVRFFGKLVNMGDYSPVWVWFQYAPANADDSCTAIDFLQGGFTNAQKMFYKGPYLDTTSSYLQNNTMYCWRAVARDNAGNQVYGEMLNFTIGTVPIEEPPPIRVTTHPGTPNTDDRTKEVHTARLDKTGKTPTTLRFEYQQPLDTAYQAVSWSPALFTEGQTHTWSPSASIVSKGSFRFRACGTDSIGQASCGSEHTITIPTGTITLAAMTSCFPEGDGLKISYQYSGGSTIFDDCEVLLDGSPTGTKIAGATSNIQHATIEKVPTKYSAVYKLMCKANAGGGYIYSDPLTIGKKCESDNLTLTHSKECIPMSPFSDSDTGTIKWKAYNGVTYSKCSASTSPEEDTGTKWKGPKANPDSEQSGFTIPFRKSPYSSITLSLTCTRKFDGEKETASKVLNKGICIYPEPEITLTANPTTVNAGKPTSTVSWNNKNVKNCALSSDPNQNILIADATTTGGDRNIDGSIKVTPTQSIEVTLTCDAVNSSFGSVSDSVFICHNSSVKSDGTGCTTGNTVPNIKEI